MLFLTLTSNVYGQNSFEVHVGPTFPIGDFSSTFHGAGGAGIGIGAGMEYALPISENGLELFFGADFFYNGLNKSTKDGLKNILLMFGATDVEFDYNHYINLPLSAGVKYWFQEKGKASFFVKGGITYNFLTISDSKSTVTVTDDVIVSSVSYDTKNRLGIRLGLGALIGEKATITFNYLALGEHDITANTLSGNERDLIEGVQNVSLMNLALGIKF